MLRAGEPEDVVIEVTNLGDSPLYQLSAITESDNPFLTRREYYFGYVGPGETGRYVQRVFPHDGMSSTMTPVQLEFRGADDLKLRKETQPVKTLGQDLPRLAYTVALVDDGSGESVGDGDGLPEFGETIEIRVTVENVGMGSATGGFVRAKNKSGRSRDLKRGSFSIGELVPTEGEPCDPELAVCDRELKPGESYTDTVAFELRNLPEGGSWEVDLQIGDNERFDYSSVSRGGFYDYFQSSETLVIQPGQSIDSSFRIPPMIEISRMVPLETKSRYSTERCRSGRPGHSRRDVPRRRQSVLSGRRGGLSDHAVFD